MKLSWTIAQRELRTGLKGFRIFLACLTLGVAAIAAIGSMSDAIEGGLLRDGKSLLGGDIDLRLMHKGASDEQLTFLKENTAQLSATNDMRAMAYAASGTRRLVEIKAVDKLYPLVGAMKLDPALPLHETLALKDGFPGAVVDANLLRRLKLKLGDKIRVGEQEFQVRAFVKGEPDRVASVMNFGPRMMVSGEFLKATGLLQPGSQIHYHYRLMMKEGVNAADFEETLKQTFPDAGWRIHKTDKAAPGIQRFVDRMTLFLSFVGLTALLVGGIGVGNAIDSYLDRKTATIATLKCLGADAKLIFKVYFLQVMALASIGVTLGLALGAALTLLGGKLLEGQLPVKPEIALYPEPLIIAGLFGLMTALTFALWPLLRAKRIPASQLFRDRIDPQHHRFDKGSALIMALAIAALSLMAVFTANDRYFAYWFVGGTATALLLLRGGASLLIRSAKKTSFFKQAEWRLGVANLHRPGNRTVSVVLSLGLGLAVLVAVALIDGNIRRQVDERLPEQAPAFFFIDIQPHQTEKFDSLVNGMASSKGYKRVASLRGRIVQINGVPVEKAVINPGSAWAVRGDRALTYSAPLPDGAKISSGVWWPEDYKGTPKISLDDNLAKGFGVGLGDTLTVNVLGRNITAEIASTRIIDWRSLRFDFAIIFAPGTLEGAPHSHIAALEAPESKEDVIEKTITDSFANVSAIRVREALGAVRVMLEGVGAAVQLSSLVTLVVGALVLAGAVAAGHSRRVYDAVVFKVLGAGRKKVLRAYLIEYGILGLTTGVLSAIIGTATAWAVMVFLMGSDWVNLPLVTIVTVLACITVTVGGGLIGTWRALGQKAAPLLRNE
ncbi:MAG: ABC transporter permease [Rhodospirillales bacterium]|nr:ABC transporter permease [Rhodospirillales bacterium]